MPQYSDNIALGKAGKASRNTGIMNTMDSSNDNRQADLLNYRVLIEAVKNKQRLSLEQRQQLSQLATKLNLPNPLATSPQPVKPQESEFVQTAKQHYLDESKKSKRRGFIGTMVNIAEVLGGAAILALIINQFVFQPYEVVGISMVPTLQNSDRLIVSKVPATWSKITRHKYIPKRYEIVVLKDTLAKRFSADGSDVQLVKRVIGLPGDRVVIKDQHIKIYNNDNPDGFNPDERLVTRDILTRPDGLDVTIGQGQIFVCGDNRPNSLDSRSEDIGPVPVEHVVGHVKMRLLPFNKAKFF